MRAICPVCYRPVRYDPSRDLYVCDFCRDTIDPEIIRRWGNIRLDRKTKRRKGKRSGKKGNGNTDRFLEYVRDTLEKHTEVAMGSNYEQIKENLKRLAMEAAEKRAREWVQTRGLTWEEAYERALRQFTRGSFKILDEILPKEPDKLRAFVLEPAMKSQRTKIEALLSELVMYPERAREIEDILRRYLVLPDVQPEKNTAIEIMDRFIDAREAYEREDVFGIRKSHDEIRKVEVPEYMRDEKEDILTRIREDLVETGEKLLARYREEMDRLRREDMEITREIWDAERLYRLYMRYDRVDLAEEQLRRISELESRLDEIADRMAEIREEISRIREAMRV